MTYRLPEVSRFLCKAEGLAPFIVWAANIDHALALAEHYMGTTWAPGNITITRYCH